MEQIQFDIAKFLSSLSDKQKKEFCLEKLDFDFLANQEISSNLFTVLLDIAANFATNRNEAIENMPKQINHNIENINVSGLVKKYNNRLKKLNKLTSEKEKEELLNTSIIEMKNNTKFPFLDETYLGQGMLKGIKDFKLTNGIFYDICLAREKFNITWETLSQFIMKKVNCSGVLPQSLSPSSINLKNKVQNLSKARKLAEKEKFLSEPFLPPQPKIVLQTEIARNNSQTTSRETEIQDSELSLLESSFSDLAQSIAELNTSYDEVESENLSLSLDIEELKSKNKKLKRQLHEKNQLLSSYGVRNFNKRERRKTDKIKKLEDTVSELTEKNLNS